MLCPTCRSTNPSAARFCMHCSAALEVHCEACGVALPDDANFCLRCGQPQAKPPPVREAKPPPVREADPEPEAQARSRIEHDGERRELTVMFCDLVDSTELAHRVDAEDLRTLVRAFQGACARVIEARNGSVAQYLGDGLLVYFGFPEAHDDDPTNAVDAALEIQATCHQLVHELHAGGTLPEDERLRVRVAVHTGPVVVSRMGRASRQELLALGDTLNLAARLQGLAESGWVVVSEATRRLLVGHFELEPLGARSLKGIPESVVVHRVITRGA